MLHFSTAACCSLLSLIISLPGREGVAYNVFSGEYQVTDNYTEFFSLKNHAPCQSVAYYQISMAKFFGVWRQVLRNLHNFYALPTSKHYFMQDGNSTFCLDCLHFLSTGKKMTTTCFLHMKRFLKQTLMFWVLGDLIEHLLARICVFIWFLHFI